MVKVNEILCSIHLPLLSCMLVLGWRARRWVGSVWSDGSGWILGYYGVSECGRIFHLSFVGRNDMKLIYAGVVWSWRAFKFKKYGN